MNRVARLAASIALATAGGIASTGASAAAVYTFNVDDSISGPNESLSGGVYRERSGDLTMSIRGFAATGDFDLGDSPIFGTQLAISHSTGHGLYIRHSSSDNTHEIDGNGLNEFAVFTFTMDGVQVPVELHGVWFNYWDGDDDYWVVRDGTVIVENQDSNPYLANFALSGMEWAVGAVGNNDDFKLRKIRVVYNPPVDVPEPAALGLLGLGLFAAAALKKRRV